MKSFIATGVLAASLAFSGTAAMAAAQTHNAATTAYAGPALVGTWPAVHLATAPAYGAAWPRAQVAARGYAPGGQFGTNIGQFIQGILGGGRVQYANRGAGGSSYSYDFSSPANDNSAANAASAAIDAQLASDAQNQAIQQMNDTMALNASMAAAEEQNDEANAATLQTEINAGM